jgi:hypothetical protein
MQFSSFRLAKKRPPKLCFFSSSADAKKQLFIPLFCLAVKCNFEFWESTECNSQVLDLPKNDLSRVLWRGAEKAKKNRKRSFGFFAHFARFARFAIDAQQRAPGSLTRTRVGRCVYV